MMQLFAMAGTCALAPNIVAIWGEVDLKVVTLERGAHREPAYLKINPKGQVPALRMDDGRVLTEATAIMRYLAAIAPNPIVHVSSDEEWARIDEALSYLTSEVHSDFGSNFAPSRFAMSDGAQDEVRQATYAKLRNHCERLAAKLDGADGQFYLGRRTIADAYLFVVLRWLDGTPIALSDYPMLLRYREMMAAETSVQAALTRQGMT
jgi:glutathione S-transferase